MKQDSVFCKWSGYINCTKCNSNFVNLKTIEVNVFHTSTVFICSKCDTEFTLLYAGQDENNTKD